MRDGGHDDEGRASADIRRLDRGPSRVAALPGGRGLADQSEHHLSRLHEPGCQWVLRGFQSGPSPGGHRVRLESVAIAGGDPSASALTPDPRAGLQGVRWGHRLGNLRCCGDGARPPASRPVRGGARCRASSDGSPGHPTAHPALGCHGGQRIHAPGDCSLRDVASDALAPERRSLASRAHRLRSWPGLSGAL